MEAVRRWWTTELPDDVAAQGDPEAFLSERVTTIERRASEHTQNYACDEDEALELALSAMIPAPTLPSDPLVASQRLRSFIDETILAVEVREASSWPTERVHPVADACDRSRAHVGAEDEQGGATPSADRTATAATRFGPPVGAGPLARSDRDDVVRALHARGKTLQEIGDALGVTRERVRQLCGELGLATGGRREREYRAAFPERDAEAREFFLALRDDRAVADRMGLAASTIGRWVDEHIPDAGVLRRSPRSSKQRFTDTDLFSSVRSAAAELPSPMAHAAYAAWCEGRTLPDGRPMPGPQGMMLRFGTWRAVLAAAGLPANPRSGPSRRFDADDALAAMVAAWREFGRPPKVASYDDWSPLNPGHPSSATIRKHYGSWDDVLLLAWQEVHGIALPDRLSAPLGRPDEVPGEVELPDQTSVALDHDGRTDEADADEVHRAGDAAAREADGTREGAVPNTTKAGADQELTQLILGNAAETIVRYAEALRPEGLTESRALRLPVAVAFAEVHRTFVAASVAEEVGLGLPADVFRGAGPLDLLVTESQRAPSAEVLRTGVELKAGRASMVDAVWDLVKLAAALRAESLDRAMLVTCAPQAAFAAARAGTGFEFQPPPGQRRPIDVAALVDDAHPGHYRDAFSRWARTGSQSPLRVPKLLVCQGLADAPVVWTDRSGGHQEWLVRATQVSLVGPVDFEWPDELRP